MPSLNEPQIQQALADLHAGVFTSYRAAASAYNLTHTTLMRRDKDINSAHSEGHNDQKLLHPDLERLLLDWILYCETCGHPVSHAQIREFVLLLLQSKGAPTKLGKRWVS